MDTELEQEVTRLHDAARELERSGDADRGRMLHCAADLVHAAATHAPAQRVVAIEDRVVAILR